MSYLSQALRLHFAGRFQATVSTVNNDIAHFNNAAFQPSWQQRQTQQAANGWWNPDGDGVWRLLGCAVTSAFMADGSPAAGSDPVLTMSVADSDDSAPAKIVDLDPQQQLVSTIFGLKVRIADSAGNTLMQGDFDPAPFTDIFWTKIRTQGASGDIAAGAMWQSVITVTQWGDISASPFLQSLRAAAEQNANLLSIKFNVDLYSMGWPTPGTPGGNQFCRGRIVGTIGPASPSEPRHFVTGRQLLVQLTDSRGNAAINYCAAVLDSNAGVIRLDLGNALTLDGTGAPQNRGALSLVVSPQGAASPTVIGQINYLAPDWYTRTAGVVEVPLPASLAPVVANNPIGLTLASLGNQVLTGEAPPEMVNNKNYPGGLYVRADAFVFRLSPGEKKQVDLYATVYGQPCKNQEIALSLDPGGLQGGAGEPPVGTPPGGLLFPAQVSSGDGHVQVTLTGGDPQDARGYIDGQVYGIGCALTTQSPNYPANPANFISVLVFDSFTPDDPPTWHGSMQPIFQQYANLYPVMKRFVDLGNYQQVVSYARMLHMAFSLPEDDPNCMPVTRDLSPAKRDAILEWLKNPLQGAPPGAPQAPALQAAMAAEPPADHAAGVSRGGKSAAFSRLVSRQSGK